MSLLGIILEGEGALKVSENIAIVGRCTLEKLYDVKEKKDILGLLSVDGENKKVKTLTRKIEKLEKENRDRIVNGYKVRAEEKQRLAEERTAKAGEVSVKRSNYQGGIMTETTYAPTQDVKLREVKTEDLLDELIRRTEENEPT